MKFALYIAKRYILAKKSHNAINLISLIAVLGVLVGTSAFILILSVFNGFDDLVQSMYNTFYTDLKITASKGKVFVLSQQDLDKISNTEGVVSIAQIVEDNALLVYEDKQTVCIVRGVSSNYKEVSDLDSMIYQGSFDLGTETMPQAILGRGIAYFLGIGLDFVAPLKINIPKRLGSPGLNPEQDVIRKYIRPTGIFATQPDIDSKYIIVPIEFARSLFQYENEVSALELNLNPDFSTDQIQKQLTEILGSDFKIENRYQQNELLYKTMRSEKWAIFLILALILVVASFNMVGSLSMLIIEKKDDAETLRALGANRETIRAIFFLEGILISFIGAFTGLLLGTLICYLQQRFGIVKLHGGGSFIIDAYPVLIKASDIGFVFLTVSVIGALSSWYPVNYFTKKYLMEK